MSQRAKIPVASIRRTSLVDEAVKVLREAILTGRLAPGARLRQVELAAQMKISRTPLREALRKLEQEGLMTVPHGGGLRVALLDLDEAVELYEIREVLDGLAARLAAQRISESQLPVLSRLLAQMKECVARQDAHRWFTVHVAFHEGIFQASANDRLQRMSSVIRLSIQRFHPVLLTTPNRLADAYREHREVFEAIQARNPEAAERLARTHIARAREIVLKVMPGTQVADSAS